MNCYLCEHPAEFSCRCLIPSVLICSEHLKFHKVDKSKKHTFDTIEDTIEANLYKEINEKLKNIIEKVLLDSDNQIKQILEETKQLLSVFNRAIQRLNRQYLEKGLNDNFFVEAEWFFVDEIDRQRFLKYIQGEELTKGENMKNIQIIKYDDGSLYEGELIADKREGKGVYMQKNGHIYTGEFKNDKKEGRGVYKLPTGDMYEGEFKDDKKEGRGVYMYLSEAPNKGDHYEGEFKGDQKNGNGIYKWASGDIYEGEFKDDKKDGRGIYKYLGEGPHKGDFYEGEFKDGSFEGKGTYTCVNGNIYQGDFKNNLFLEDTKFLNCPVQ